MGSSFMIVLVPADTKDVVGKVGTLLNQYTLPLTERELDEWPDIRPSIDEWWVGVTPYDGCVRGAAPADEVDLEVAILGHNLSGNVIPVSEVPPSLDVMALVTPDGQWHHFYRGHGTDIIPVDSKHLEWQTRRNSILARNQNCLAVGVKTQA